MGNLLLIKSSVYQLQENSVRKASCISFKMLSLRLGQCRRLWGLTEARLLLVENYFQCPPSSPDGGGEISAWRAAFGHVPLPNLEIEIYFCVLNTDQSLKNVQRLSTFQNRCVFATRRKATCVCKWGDCSHFGISVGLKDLPKESHGMHHNLVFGMVESHVITHIRRRCTRKKYDWLLGKGAGLVCMKWTPQKLQVMSD